MYCTKCGHKDEDQEHSCNNYGITLQTINISKGEPICPACKYGGRPEEIAKGGDLVAVILPPGFPRSRYIVFEMHWFIPLRMPNCGYQHRQDIVK